MSQRVRPPRPQPQAPEANQQTPDEVAKQQAEEQEKAEKNDRLINELMILKFRIKMCSDLYKVNMKGTTQLRKKLNSVYLKKLKRYCELNNGIFDTDLLKKELDLELDDLQNKIKQIQSPITGL